MYEACFGLSKRPFASVPQVDQYYPGTAIEAARQTLARCIERAEGVGMVVGPSGTGKTLLCQMLAQQFGDSFKVVLLTSGRLSTRRALLQAILFGLGQPYRGMDEGELRLAMVDHLTLGEDCPRGMLLLADEAHTLPLRLLEEIRMITNLASEGQPRARLVLAGGSMLEERFASPKLDSFSQRVVARCYLDSFNREETQGYIHSQIGWAGGEGEQVISLEACHAVYQATDGVPRLINQVCDHALLLACAAGRQPVDGAAVEEAWADLQQLPPPWRGDAEDGKSGEGVIEFGGLEDESEKDDEAIDPDRAAGDQEPSVPMLRVAPDSEEPAPDPVDQVDRIQQTLASLDEDFQPAGSIGPELELVFDDPEGPFDEEFEEEEVIVDYYQRPRAGETVQEPPGPPEHPQEMGPLEGPETEESAAQDEPAVPEAPVTSDAAEQEPTFEEGAAEVPGAGISDEDTDLRWAEQPETVPLHAADTPGPAEPKQAVAADETPMIIVEEGYEEPEPSGARPAARVRRQEYGQLFARLRRSC